jgi:hypothetical protein
MAPPGTSSRWFIQKFVCDTTVENSAVCPPKPSSSTAAGASTFMPWPSNHRAISISS